MSKLDPTTTALLLVDLQNDCLHPKGAYGRAGLMVDQIAQLPSRLRPLADALRKREGWVVATHFTILEGKHGKPLLPEHLQKLRPFLVQGDFKPGSWGHRMVDELGEADLHVDKVSFSAFYMTPLEWILRQTKVDTILLSGVTSPVSIAATLRDALQRDFRTIVLEDGCGAYEAKLHRSAISEMASTAPIKTCADALECLR